MTAPSSDEPERSRQTAGGEGASLHHSPGTSQRRIPWWWPLVPQIVGLAGVIYEVLGDRLDRPWVMVGCTTLAVGGKLADAARDILRG